MNPNENNLTSRRQFIKAAGSVAAASALSGVNIPAVHAQGSSLIQVAFVGCGGRGGGAAAPSPSSTTGPVKRGAQAAPLADPPKTTPHNPHKGKDTGQPVGVAPGPRL